MIGLAEALIVIYIFLLGIWALLVWGCVSIAKGKGRSAVAWALLGVFFGIFALVLVAMLPRVDTAEERKAL